jgi:hypothetical protein
MISIRDTKSVGTILMGDYKKTNEDLEKKYCNYREVLEKMKLQIDEDFDPEIIKLQLEDNLNLY